MKKGWRVAVYAFYTPDPAIEYRTEGRRRRKCHVFTCIGKGCGKRIVRYLDTGDAQSTGNMRRHVAKCPCWGPDILKAADNASNLKDARENIVKNYLRDGSITAIFVRKLKGKITYSHRQHTRGETR